MLYKDEENGDTVAFPK